MTPEERAAILDALARLPRQEAELGDPLRTFLPLAAHRHALWPEAVVILGGRGAGKTALFRLVNDARTAARLRVFFEDDRIPESTWIDAFSQAGMNHPEVGTLEAWATSASDLSLRAFWMAHLLRRVHEEMPGLVALPPAVEPLLRAPVADLAAWLPAAEASLGAVSAALDATERALAAADRSVFATYDNLDRIGQHEPGIRRRYVSTLLALWLSLANRYKKLRGKIFLRDDLFDAAELAFADATKLRARAETITWDHAALYRVVVRHLAGVSEAARVWLRGAPGLALRDRGELGWVPGEMPDDAQRGFLALLSSRVIGRGVLKGPTHRWIVNRLQDANGRVTPRAILWFFGFAGEEAQKRPAGRRKTLLISDDFVEALRSTSRERVTEIKEEYPPATRMERLRGMSIPLAREEAVQRLGIPRLNEREGIPAQGDVILGELIRLGVLKAREDGQLDVPDVYRYAFEIAPDYATAWGEFLKEDKPSAKEMFIRELPTLDEILRKHGAGKWAAIAQDEMARGDYSAARAQCERALDLARSGSDLVGEIHVMFGLGRIDQSEGNHDDAEEKFQRALGLARRAEDKQLEADAHSWLGLHKWTRGEDGEAEEHTNKALAFFENKKMHVDEAASRVILAMISAERGQHSTAVSHLTRVLSITPRDGPLRSMAFETLAEIAESQGNVRHAALLMAIAALASDVVNDAGQRWSKFDQLSTTLGYTPERVEELRREAGEAYEADGGSSLIDRAFG